MLVITIDTTVIGLRERESRDGMEQMLRGTPWSRIPFIPQVFARPHWFVRFLLDGGLPNMPNIVTPDRGVLRVRDAHTAIKRTAFFWDDMSWIRALWKGPIVIKGVLTAEDARKAIDSGAQGIVVSNHGGRQLDYAPPTLRVLPEIVAAVRELPSPQSIIAEKMLEVSEVFESVNVAMVWLFTATPSGDAKFVPSRITPAKIGVEREPNSARGPMTFSIFVILR